MKVFVKPAILPTPEHFAHLAWPFFDARHGPLVEKVEDWALTNMPEAHSAPPRRPRDVDDEVQRLIIGSDLIKRTARDHATGQYRGTSNA
jgi:hypothetical protein